MRPGSLMLIALLAFVPSRPAPAVDYNGFHASLCQPRAPGTTSGELSYGAFGVSNLGDTDEGVLCPLVSDTDAVLTAGDNGKVFVRWRTGTVPGRIICTLFVGAYGYDNANSAAYSATSPMQPANSPIAEMALTIVAPAGQSRPPVMSVACILGPKVMLGGLLLREN